MLVLWTTRCRRRKQVVRHALSHSVVGQASDRHASAWVHHNRSFVVARMPGSLSNVHHTSLAAPDTAITSHVRRRSHRLSASSGRCREQSWTDCCLVETRRFQRTICRSLIHDVISDHRIDLLVATETWMKASQPAAVTQDIAPTGFQVAYCIASVKTTSPAEAWFSYTPTSCRCPRCQ